MSGKKSPSKKSVRARKPSKAARKKAFKDFCDKLPIDKSMGKIKPSDLAFPVIPVKKTGRVMTLESAPKFEKAARKVKQVAPNVFEVLEPQPNFSSIGNRLPPNEQTVPFDDKLLAAIKSDPAPVLGADKLDHIRDLAKAMRDIDKQIKDTEELLKERKARLFTLQMEELPDLFAEYKVPSITLEAEGNNPKVTLTAQPFYKAVMPEDSAPGFEWLEAEGHGDLIKRVFTVALPMDSVKLADRFRNGMIKAGIPFEEKKTVPWTTLTAFVKEQIEKHHASLPLEKLGAFVGKIVKIKESKK